MVDRLIILKDFVDEIASINEDRMILEVPSTPILAIIVEEDLSGEEVVEPWTMEEH